MTGTGTLTITDFLLARIAEDEKMANAALGCHAYAQDYPTRAVMYSASGDALFEFDERQMREADHSTLALAEHFCSWQPARVLAECKAKREIVECHRPTVEHVEWFDCTDSTGKGEVCPSCRPAEPTVWNPEIGAAGIRPAGFVAPYVLSPCPTLAQLATVYASHPDYDPAWAPKS